MAQKTITVVDKIKQMDARLLKLEKTFPNLPKDTVPELSGILERLEKLEGQLARGIKQDKISMLIFNNEFDKAVAAFIIATGAAAMGMEVVMFFTFWGTSILKKKGETKGKNFLEKMFGVMLPRGSKKLGTSHFNMAGMGPGIFRHMMKKKGVSSLEELIQMAMELGVKIILCEMTKELLGIKDEELIAKFETAGAAAFLNEAYNSSISYVI